MNSHKDRETRLSCICLAHIFVGNTGTNLRGLPSLSVIEPGANLKLYAIITTDKNSSAHITASACALLMSDDCCLGIFKLFDFKQEVAAFVLVLCVWVLDHDALTATSCDTVKFFRHVLKRGDLGMLH